MAALIILIVYFSIGFGIAHYRYKYDTQINKDVVEYSLHINFWPLILLGELLENLFNKVYNNKDL